MFACRPLSGLCDVQMSFVGGATDGHMQGPNLAQHVEEALQPQCGLHLKT
jgi:hypothetical protein